MINDIKSKTFNINKENIEIKDKWSIINRIFFNLNKEY
jgi:hypothetical protein